MRERRGAAWLIEGLFLFISIEMKYNLSEYERSTIDTYLPL